jgi:hypothetical protein
MSISLSDLVRKPPTQAQAAEDLKELKGAAQLSDGLTPEGQDVEAALQALTEGDDGSSSGAPDSGCCSDSTSDKPTAGTTGSVKHIKEGTIPNPEGISPGAKNGVTVIGEGKTPNLQRSPAGTAGSNPTLAEGRVPNPDVAPTGTAPAVTAPAAPDSPTAPDKNGVPSYWSAVSQEVNI